MITTAGQRRVTNAPEATIDDANSEPDCTGSEDYCAVERVAVQLLRPWRRKITSLVGDTPNFLQLPVRRAVADLHALTRNDPASQGDWQHVLSAYLCFHAILGYRIAHAVGQLPGQEANTVARCISERAKVETGVEIHPRAHIGPRLVIDHGMGTVIGETTVIGADCYLLQGVVLGATGISGNASNKRHPTLGNRVQVGGFARILGPVTIGDDVVVGCHTLVRQDVPAGSRVTTLHQYQIVSGPGELSVDDVEFVTPGRLRLRGMNLDTLGLAVQLLGPDHEPLDAVRATVAQRAHGQLVLDVDPPFDTGRGTRYVRIAEPAGSSITVAVPFPRAGCTLRRHSSALPAQTPTENAV